MTTNAVELSGIVQKYGSQTVLDGLDLAIPRGSTYALLGNNGAGKSTAIRLITGQLQPDAGNVEALGFDPVRQPVPFRLRLGYVPEAEKLYDFLTPPELFRFLKGFFPDWNDCRAAELMKRFALPADRKISVFSRGMYAKVCLITVLARTPELVILDDPTLGLDTVSRREFLSAIIESIQEYEHTLIISSHLIPELESICDHAGILSGGRMRCSAPVDQLKTELRRIRLPDRNLPQLPGELCRTVAAGELCVVVRNSADDFPPDAAVEPMTLEEIFLALTQ